MTDQMRERKADLAIRDLTADIYIRRKFGNQLSDIERALRTSATKSEAKDLQSIVDNIAGGVMAQREEVLRAFVAKYGFQPDEAVQVVGNDGSWHVIRHSEMYRKPETVEVTDAMVRTLASHVGRIFDVEGASDSAFIADMRFALEAALQADAGGEGVT